MSKIIIDLDVMLASYSRKFDDKKTRAMNLIRGVKAGKYEIYTPFTLMDIVAGWKIEYFRDRIHRFYGRYSKEIITSTKLDEKLQVLGKEIKPLLQKLIHLQIKEEDAVLAVIASSFELELKTFNQKHLLGKKVEINKILKEEGMKEILISEP